MAITVKQVKQENGKFFYKSERGEWREYASIIKSFDDIKKTYHIDIEIVGKVETPSKPGYKADTVEVLRYDGTHLCVRDSAGERIITFPNGDRNQIQSFLETMYEKVIPNPLFARLKGQTRDEEETYNQWARRQPQHKGDQYMQILADWQADESKTE